ncbi:dihydrofolate reductase [Cohaesibacter gelatinilyticus]|uniref:Dihydrofolate reductase n=1 Tax=Cohaesibacter gelatinilyticus TaxID=372072 RepID=A0A285NHP8_9HYPH|nr:dihydrofolate reductase [Cohaesibacter gelatinilyticus]SNZ09000.1 dihydrofolate reductase [Cohaesibacter gelatinilyticus]HAT87524.1 dihydrofolate reductase [Hyphomicrobiales bacterium]
MVQENSQPKIVFHFAVADNGVIGKDNDMPWHVSSDLKRFKALTMGKPLLMGRRTFESIGRPLPGRANVVITRDETFSAKGILIASSIENAMEICEQDADVKGVDEIAVIGGGSIYKALWDRADRLYVTHVHAEPEGDTFVPDIDEQVWKQISKDETMQGERDSAPMTFAIYERR